MASIKTATTPTTSTPIEMGTALQHSAATTATTPAMTSRLPKSTPPTTGSTKTATRADDYDADGDGHADARFGGDDCDDYDPHVWESCDACVDADGDGAWGNCDNPGSIGVDCDDANHRVISTCATCRDGDEDGYFVGCDNLPAAEPPDCDDTNPLTWTVQACTTCRDEDGDGAWTGCDTYPPGESEDCDDAIENTWTLCSWCFDADGDGWGAGTCNSPQLDCDDSVSNAWASCNTCEDADSDGLGSGACDTAPQDADPSNPNHWSVQRVCADNDQDGYFVDCDDYLSVARDCDDSDPTSGAATWEVPNDGIDQDCNGIDLTFTEDQAVFVEQAGSNAPGCGSKTAPCGTIQHANDIASRSRRVVVAASGVFQERVRLHTSLYGGFDASSWTRPSQPAGETVLYTASIHGNTDHPEIVVSNVTFQPEAENGSLQATVQSVHSRTWLDAVKIRSPIDTVPCRSLLSTRGELLVTNSLIETCDPPLKAWSVILGDDRGLLRRARLEDTRIELDASSGDECTGVSFRGQALEVARSEIHVAGCDDMTAIDVIPPTSPRLHVTPSEHYVQLDDSRIEVTTGDLGSGLVVEHTPTISLLRTQIHVDSAVSSTGVRIVTRDHNTHGHTGNLRVDTSLVRSTSELAASALLVAGAPDNLILQATLIANTADAHRANANAVLLRAPGVLHVQHSILHSNGVPLAVASSSVLDPPQLYARGNLLSADCTFLPDGAACTTQEFDALATCNWFGCGGFEGSLFDEPGFLDTSTGELLATSPAVDAATTLLFEQPSPTDLYGQTRSLGGTNDLGAVESH